MTLNAPCYIPKPIIPDDPKSDWFMDNLWLILIGLVILLLGVIAYIYKPCMKKEKEEEINEDIL